jgi:hypothetical protein
MGLFSSIKKGLSKAWSGTKKAVKGVARSIKKVAKKVAYATPWGKKLWDLSTKVGEGIMKGVGKLSAKLGPVGMMALSFVLAPVMGPMVSSLWAGVSGAAGTLASSAATFMSSLGSVGSAIVSGVTTAANGIYAAGNFIGGTLGAMGNAITEGAANVMAGNFSGAASSFATNMTNAFTGKAGMAAVHAGQAVSGTLASDAASTVTNTQGAALQRDGIFLSSPVNAPVDISGLTADQLANQTALGIAPGQAATEAATAALTSSPVAEAAFLGGPSQAALDSQVAQYGMTSAQMSAIPDAANGFVMGGKLSAQAVASGNIASKSSLLDKAKKAKDLYDNLSGGGAAGGGYQPYVPKAIQSQSIQNAGGVSGTGSSGFSLLSGVRGLEQSIRNSQNMMFG